jgi:hypothetical protein
MDHAHAHLIEFSDEIKSQKQSLDLTIRIRMKRYIAVKVKWQQTTTKNIAIKKLAAIKDFTWFSLGPTNAKSELFNFLDIVCLTVELMW